jgi:carboxypeptidase C (cathepsin A)
VLLGESYGTLRTPAVADYLQVKRGLFVDGIALVSSLMDVAGATFSIGNNLGAVGLLPSYAATALFHGVTKGDLASVLAEAEDFALNEYSVALLKGSRLTPAETDKITKKMSKLTGISRDFLVRSNLRVPLWRFTKELLRDRRLAVGRLDTRWVGVDVDAAGDIFVEDPSLWTPTGPATRAFNNYIRNELGWEDESNLTYRHMQAFPAWKPRESEQQGIWAPQLETASLLRSAVNRAPNLKVLLQSGIYDLGTPYFTAELTFDHLYFEPDRARNITMTRYEAGHMMYLHEPSLLAMRADLGKFLGEVRAPLV